MPTIKNHHLKKIKASKNTYLLYIGIKRNILILNNIQSNYIDFLVILN